MMEHTIVELHEELKNNKVTSQELVDESLKKSHEVQEKCNAFVTILDDAKGTDVTEDLLSGIPYTLSIITGCYCFIIAINHFFKILSFKNKKKNSQLLACICFCLTPSFPHHIFQSNQLS